MSLQRDVSFKQEPQLASGGHLVARQNCDTSSEQYEPGMFSRVEYLRIQALCERRFTLDAYSDADGCNSHCSEFCSPARPFLQHPVQGCHVWLHAPDSCLLEYIQHYRRQKELAPRTTSACILVEDLEATTAGDAAVVHIQTGDEAVHYADQS